MIKRKEDITITTENNGEGKTKLYLSNLRDFDKAPEKLRMYAKASLLPNEEVEFHVHEGECEFYYIISGKALYDDNGTKLQVEAGDVTFTPSGSGHGIKNISSEPLEFMALIVKD